MQNFKNLPNGAENAKILPILVNPFTYKLQQLKLHSIPLVVNFLLQT